MRIYQRDSIYIKEKGDSVLVVKHVYRDRFVYKTDSIMVHDTLLKAVVNRVPVERELSKTQKAAQTSGWILWVLLLMGLLYLIYKLFKH